MLNDIMHKSSAVRPWFAASLIAASIAVTGCTTETTEDEDETNNQSNSDEEFEPPKVTFETRTNEVSETVGTHQVVATLARPVEKSVEVSLEVSGTAQEGGDYTIDRPASINFDKEQESAEIAIEVIEDDIPEGGETITLTMTDADNAVLPDARRDEGIGVHSVIIMGDNALNDTGLTTFSDGTNADLSIEPASHPGQDASFGRDAQSKPDHDGESGFSFTKLDSDGNPLPSNSPTWSCTRDNTTGLVWENKSADKAMDTTTNGDGETINPAVSGREFRAGNFIYGWRKSEDSSDIGGSPGIVEDRKQQMDRDEPVSTTSETQHDLCGFQADSDRRYCNTKVYLKEMNSQSVCGFKDWRMPEASELRSLASHATETVSTLPDNRFFSNIKEDRDYFSDTPAADNEGSAWCFNFTEGNVKLCQKNTYRGFIGVRSSEQ